ncbi:NrdH-redoxin [Candidatus Woesearchaeota archaeon]|nr:NrdH-redoxin [Candidatus Woesearchaeota archaeon]
MKVTLYTAPGCPFCVIVKKYLERNSVKFEEVDISKDDKRKNEMEKKSNQTNVPVVDANGTIIIGYNLKKLKEAMAIE